MTNIIQLPPDRRLTKREITIGETHIYYTHFPNALKEPVPGANIVNEVAYLCASIFGPEVWWYESDHIKFWRPLKRGEWAKTTIVLSDFDEKKYIARLAVEMTRVSNGKTVFTADYTIVLLR